MDPFKVAGIVQWPVPSNVKDVQAFLGFGNFYRRFIRNFSKIARPMFDLTKKDTPFAWSDDCQAAFITLKDVFTSSPVLIMPDPAQPYCVEVDASDYATGGILQQKGPTTSGTLLLICQNLSRTLNEITTFTTKNSSLLFMLWKSTLR